MLWWIPIAVAGLAALGVLTVVASTAAGRSAGRHVLTGPQEEWDAYVAEGRSYGSMVLAEEQHHEEWLPAPTVDPAPWRAQMKAELSPEALDDDEPLSPPPSSHPVWRNPRLNDPGPGDAAVEPPASSGPDQPPARATPPPYADPPGAAEERPPPGPGQSRWLAEQLEVLRAWAERQQAYAEILA